MASKIPAGVNQKFRLAETPSDSHAAHSPIRGLERQPLVTLDEAIEPLEYVIPELEEMLSSVRESNDHPKDGLSRDESASIRLYTLGWKTLQTSFHYILNTALRSDDRRELSPWFPYLRLFLFSLSKLPSSTDRTFFCGATADVADGYPPGKVFVWWDFISCTSSMKYLERSFDRDGTKTIFIVECESVKDISEHSFYDAHDEYLLYPARQFRVLSSFDSSDHLKMIHLREIQPSSPLIHIPEATSADSPTSANIHRHQPWQQIIDAASPRTVIDLHEQSLVDDDMDTVVEQGIVAKQCKELWLQGNQISSVGISPIAQAFKQTSFLHVLILHDNNLGDQGIRSLATALSLSKSNLNVLGLESTGITDQGAAYLAEMLTSNTTLTSLGLGENDIGDRGAQLLANALDQKNNTLQELYLVKNKRISDSCVDAFVTMLGHNRTLNRLWIDGCSLSAKGNDKLRRKVHSRNRFSLSL